MTPGFASGYAVASLFPFLMFADAYKAEIQSQICHHEAMRRRCVAVVISREERWKSRQGGTFGTLAMTGKVAGDPSWPLVSLATGGDSSFCFDEVRR